MTGLGSQVRPFLDPGTTCPNWYDLSQVRLDSGASCPDTFRYRETP